ncbi:4-alpha-glucanotransferase [Streptomyces sp. WMMC500]|uniref:4-alpha-glucanotransferase n=1 Tax=Streptomyces sp. WMMC500 TaxID=3015154 RepID=UPI00248CB25B|nr:4-alpha-glucanotransferase [Streptomyces sp. WMMC500]WBB59309.1 4-alpha-glucanotransferase [Streptomyces sp. WMMC500]
MSLARLAALHGVAVSHEHTPGRALPVPEDTLVAVLAALGVDASGPTAVAEALAAYEKAERDRLLPAAVVPPAGTRLDLDPLPDGTETALTGEDGDALDPRAPLPLGVHTLTATAPDGRTGRATVIAAPTRVPQPRRRGAGLALPLPALLSGRSWGMGDLGDLAELAAWSARTHGMDFVQLAPLHAAVPGAAGRPADPSPYRPSSRRFADPVHLRIEDIPEYRYLAPADRAQADELAGRAAALREKVRAKGGLIDRDEVWRLKRAALELLRRVELTPGRRVAYHHFLAEQGQPLDDYAAWCALAEIHGPDWRSWPGGLADPRSTATTRARHDLLDRIDFHCRLAWLTDNQLWRAQRIARDAGMAVGVVHDLAAGVHPSGADAWAEQSVLAAGCTAGDPPDARDPRGTDRGVPPWRPDKLAAAGYGPYRSVLRAALRRAGALRIGHVSGLFRQWWVPAGRAPAEGTYVAYDAAAMLGVLALEAHRAGTPVIGEDPGGDPADGGVRDALAVRGVLGTSVLWTQRTQREAAPETVAGVPCPRPPEVWRADALAAVTGPDLPPTAARISGAHLALRHELGLLDAPLPAARVADAVEVGTWLDLLERLRLLPGGRADEASVITGLYRLLARSPARLVAVWLPDAAGDRRPQHVPGAGAEYPGWKLPVADPDGRTLLFEELADAPRTHRLLAEVVRELGGGDDADPDAPDGEQSGGEQSGERESGGEESGGEDSRAETRAASGRTSGEAPRA